MDEVTQRTYYDDRIPYLHVLEDEVVDMKARLAKWKVGHDRDRAHYGNDLITAAGMGNLIMVRNILDTFHDVSQLG